MTRWERTKASLVGWVSDHFISVVDVRVAIHGTVFVVYDRVNRKVYASHDPAYLLNYVRKYWGLDYIPMAHGLESERVRTEHYLRIQERDSTAVLFLGLKGLMVLTDVVDLSDAIDHAPSSAREARELEKLLRDLGDAPWHVYLSKITGYPKGKTNVVVRRNRT